MTVKPKVPVKIIAHRGNSSEAPENTMAAFKSALALDVDYLECDVQITGDGIPVVVHDGTLSRVTKNLSRHPVDSMTLKEIKEIDIGSWFSDEYAGEKIPTLEELLDYPRGRAGIMIELKEETFNECHLAKLLADILRTHPHKSGEGPILVGSLNSGLLLCLEGYLPMQMFIPVIHDKNRIEEYIALQPRHYAINSGLASSGVIQELQDEGGHVWAWTVDDKGTALSLVHKGVDGLITNRPKEMIEILAKKS